MQNQDPNAAPQADQNTGEENLQAENTAINAEQGAEETVAEAQQENLDAE